MRSIAGIRAGIRASLALAALFVTSFVGLANADDQTSARFDVAGTGAADRGPAALPDTNTPGLDVQRLPSAPQAMTSNQYPAEVEPNDTSATATPVAGSSATREGNIFGNGDGSPTARAARTAGRPTSTTPTTSTPTRR
ncbi:MAG TPA: hypothetical protein VLF18_21460 [Tahibacter sp.]|uniref:hypothetical protein n=1 Tax=Tahibacter sp. TaxID=2056211 RepID=UPI002C14631B|nr:hypothetical protein [Tahibacter sp.]HSX62759.1 hypothetical protein [Tahibacter sp.]